MDFPAFLIMSVFLSWEKARSSETLALVYSNFFLTLLIFSCIIFFSQIKIQLTEALMRCVLWCLASYSKCNWLDYIYVKYSWVFKKDIWQKCWLFAEDLWCLCTLHSYSFISFFFCGYLNPRKWCVLFQNNCVLCSFWGLLRDLAVLLDFKDWCIRIVWHVLGNFSLSLDFHGKYIWEGLILMHFLMPVGFSVRLLVLLSLELSGKLFFEYVC